MRTEGAGAAGFIVAAADRLDRFLHVCESAFLVLGNAFLAIMVGLNIVNITLRVVIGKDIIWVFPITLLVFVWMAFVGFFVVSRQRRDIRVNFLMGRSEWTLGVSRHATNAVIMTLMGLIIWYTPYVMEQQAGEIEFLEISRSVKSVPMFVSAVLIFLSFLVDSIFAFAGRPEPRPNVVGEG